ncbi:MAG: hypothetical protein RIQ65_96 [Pseudomonadota bacterium]|jgi:hypothetical protein
MFEYDDNNDNNSTSSEPEEKVVPKPKTTKTVKSTKSVKSKPEPQPESESDTSSDSESETNSKPEKFLDGTNFDDFAKDKDQNQIQVQEQIKDEQEVVLSADEIDELRELLKNWLELDETAKKLSDEMKDIKMEKKQYETYILGFMDKTKKEIIKASDSNVVLRKEVKETRAKPSEENILKVLTRVLGDAGQAYKFTQEIIEDAPLKETISLKKDTAKKSTKKTTKRVKKDI